MDKKYSKGLLVFLFLLCSPLAYAYDFEVDGIYYNIIKTFNFTNSAGRICEVTYHHDWYTSKIHDEYSGSVVIPSNVEYNDVTYTVTSIGIGAFSDCTNLTKVAIPNSVTNIGDCAFQNCTSLEHVTLPDSLFIIRSSVFSGCTSLKGLTIPNSVVSIGSYAFADCSNLTEVSIPSGVESIGDHAFSGCASLTSIEIPSSVKSIGYYALYGCSNLNMSSSYPMPSSLYDQPNNMLGVEEMGAKIDSLLYFITSEISFRPSFTEYSDIPVDAEIIEILNRIFSSMGFSVPSMEDLAFLDLLYRGEYAKAMVYETERSAVIEDSIGKETPEYALSLCKRATANANLGNYEEAIRLETEALHLLGVVKGNEHPDYIQSLKSLANYYSALNNYSEAIRLNTEIMEIYERLYGKDSLGCIGAYDNLSECYADDGNYDKAIYWENKVTDLYKGAIKENGWSMSKYGPYPAAYYAASLSKLMNYQIGQHNYYLAMRLGIEALETMINTTSLRTDNENLRRIIPVLHNLAILYFNSGEYFKSLRIEDIKLQIINIVSGEYHPDYAMCLGNIAHYSYLSHNYNKTSQCAIKATQILSQIIKSTFGDLTAYERRLFWEKYNSWYENYLPSYAFYIMDSDSLATTVYNGTLMSKGLLLNSEIEMGKLLLESGDTTAIEKYQELLKNRMRLGQLLESQQGESLIDKGILESIIRGQEQELVQLSKTYGDYTRNMSIDWRQVRDKLDDEDVAIEFLKFNALNDSVMYVALTLSKNDSCPRMIPLFEKNELDGIKNLYSKETSELVWKPLAEVIEGKRNIYFSPAGELHNMAIESLPCFDKEGYMSDKWNIYRLSSTRELALEKDRYAVRDACIYGDLRYNMGVDGLVANSEEYEDTKRGVDWETVDIADSLGLRGSRLDPLPATRQEIENVDRALKEQHVNTTLLADTIGTETSFKALSGKRTNIMHIATHGFYWTESKVESTNARRIKTLMEADMGPTYVEDKAMTRSGLFFAGAQNALDGDEIPENVDDGILTAKEISMLDLRGLDLVVLSACDTGMGDITGDGVFGLQRGFKKAGAQTIVMSLWDVDDAATEALMSQFYSNLANGYTKYEAFQRAQRYLRGIDGYHKPEYWASFIILDAID